MASDIVIDDFDTHESAQEIELAESGTKSNVSQALSQNKSGKVPYEEPIRDNTKLSNVNKKDLLYLRENASFSELQIHEWYNDFQKYATKGSMRQDGMNRLYEKFFPLGDTKEFSREVFRTIDLNKNGRVTFREFMCKVNIILHGTRRQYLKWVFEMFDGNEDSKLHRDEIYRLLHIADGLQGREFVERNSEARHQFVEKLFNRLDVNSSGALTMDEFIAGSQKYSAFLNFFSIR